MAEGTGKSNLNQQLKHGDEQVKAASDLARSQKQARMSKSSSSQARPRGQGLKIRGNIMDNFDQLADRFYGNQMAADDQNSNNQNPNKSGGGLRNRVNQEIEATLADENFQAQLLQQQQQEAALRQAQQAAAADKGGQSALAKVKDKMKGGKAAIKKASAKILQWSWENLFESFGATMILIDAVVFLSLVMGKDSICKLGHEWVPDQIAKVDPKKAEALGDKLAIPETMGCACINGCCGFVFMVVVVIIAIVVGVVDDPIGAFKAFFSSIWTAIFGS